jgi:hypothetical protein
MASKIPGLFRARYFLINHPNKTNPMFRAFSVVQGWVMASSSGHRASRKGWPGILNDEMTHGI